MKTKILLFLCFCILLVSCKKNEEQPKESKAGIVLGGEHKLQKMCDVVGFDSKLHASFFLFFGDLNQEQKSSTRIKFAWEMNNGQYALSSLPLEKFRIQFDSTRITPTIKFRWIPYDGLAQTQEIMDYCVCYALLTVKESDWPPQINLPLSTTSD